MTVRIESGFDALAESTGAFTIRIDHYISDVYQSTPVSVTLNYSANADNIRSHGGWQEYLGGTNGYPSFLFDFYLDVNWSPIVEFSYSFETGKYTFFLAGSPANETIEVVFISDGLKEILGFTTATPPRAAAVTSDSTARYWMELTHGIRYDSGEDYEPQSSTSVTEGWTGDVWGISPAGAPVCHDFVISAETHAKTFKWYNANQGYPNTLTLEELFEHARARYWFMVGHETGAALHRLRPDACAFDHTRVFPESDKAFDVPMATYVVRL